MKNKLVFIIVGVLFFSSFSAQVVNAQSSSNDAQKLVGTWTDTFGNTWTFQANGSFGNNEGKYSVVDTKLIVLNNSGNLSLHNIFISDDGKTLIIIRERFYSANEKRFYGGDSQYAFYLCTKN